MVEGLVAELVLQPKLRRAGDDQIAEVQGVSPSAIKSRLVRGRKRLRSIYTKRFGVSDLAAEALVSGGTP